MKKCLLVIVMAVLAVCALAVAVSASTIYRDENGTELFRCEIADTYHIDSYEIKNGGFAKYDSDGDALTWYLDSTTAEGTNVIKLVKSAKTKDVYVNGAYTNGVNKNLVVSANYVEGTNTVPVFGAYSGTYNKELLFIYIPDAVTTLPYRFCQNVPVIECVFSENSLCASWDKLTFWGAKSLRGLFIPKYFTEFPESSDGEFNGCTRMEYLTFHEESTLEVWPQWYFASTKIKEIRVPDSITYLRSRAFQGMGYLETVYLSPNLTHMYKDSKNHSMFHGCGSLKTVYIPKTLVAENLIDNYGGGFDYSFSSGDGVTFVYTGTLEEFMEIKAVICKASDNKQLSTATVENGRIVIADHCKVFYGGHNMSTDTEMKLTSYFDAIKFASVCLNENCGYAGFDESKTIGALFVDYGYSATEVAINGVYAMSQFYGINKDAVEQYRKIGTGFEFGAVVAASADPFGAIESGELDASRVFVTEEKLFAYDYVSVSIGGITEASADKAVLFCLYVKDGGKTTYLDGGKSVDSVAVKSYNDVLALQKVGE